MSWRLVSSALISLLGLSCALWYFARWLLRGFSPRPVGRTERPEDALIGRRPWRGVGALLCGLLAPAFFVGVNYIDPRREPRAFLLLWCAVLLGLAVLCGLAIYDILYTRRQRRRIVRSWRQPARPDE